MNDTSEKLWNKDYILIMLSSTGISFCNYFFFSALPIYAQNITGTVASAGLMTAAYTLAALAIRPLSGVFADKFGRTKLLILGAILCSIACMLYHYAAILLVLIVIRSLHGIGFGMHSTAGGAVAADVIPKSRMAEGLGYFGLYGTIAAAIALSSPGSARSQSGVPAMPPAPRPMLRKGATACASLVPSPPTMAGDKRLPASKSGAVCACSCKVSSEDVSPASRSALTLNARRWRVSSPKLASAAAASRIGLA